jgi:hypothetical protein
VHAFAAVPAINKKSSIGISAHTFGMSMFFLQSAFTGISASTDGLDDSTYNALIFQAGWIALVYSNVLRPALDMIFKELQETL